MADWNPRANDLFLRAAEIESPEERRAFLDRECGDAALRREVEALLAASAKAVGFLSEPAVGDPLRGYPANGTAAFEPMPEAPGTVVGPYKLLQQIGEGGFGVVYMAEQGRPVRRLVALKVIKPGMDTAAVLARFEAERQALALMDHPNIAKVLDAGATDSGRPYFVMELVKGVPVTEFCDRNHLPPEQRLKLFVDVCHAIQHAHHKGVIHRDVKPTNVLVTLHDGVPVVKVIDFGVAKATAQKLTEKTLFTAYGQMVGTPPYMSPEQAEMSGLDVDTRSDVYSLGVLLYELLTGTTPLEGKRLRQAGYAEMQRLIREEDPPRPSTRLSALGESATVLAGNRGTDPKHLARLLAGDLDWVVMKALEKDRTRRYDTPGTFADDVARYLRREAVLARPPSAAYRLRKFAQRNRAAVLTAAAVAAALLLGTAVATWQAVRATAAERDARAARDAAEAERDRAVDAERRAVGQQRRADDEAAAARAI
ncbi:MAG TPA: serine/threonine-protein kinase, partial [Gemmataceae bacterium]